MIGSSCSLILRGRRRSGGPSGSAAIGRSRPRGVGLCFRPGYFLALARQLTPSVGPGKAPAAEIKRALLSHGRRVRLFLGARRPESPAMSSPDGASLPPRGGRLSRAAHVIVVNSVMFKFISYWRTAAVVLCDLAST